MKSIVILYKDSKSFFGDEKVFDGKSAFDFSKAWAESLSSDVFYIEQCEKVSELFSQMNKLCKDNNADYAIFAFADLPFLNVELTKELINTHETYKAEYTFADGYSYGFAPQLIDAGTINILQGLSESVQKEDGEKSVEKDSIFSFIKKDINSYEIESVLANTDWRLFRYSFDCSTKENFISCKELFNQWDEKDSVEDLEEKASKNPKILKTIPAYFNIQIQDSSKTDSIYSPYSSLYEKKFGIKAADSKTFMDFDKFSKLIDSINEFNDKAVINLSAFGEPFENQDLIKYIEKILSYKGLSVFIETDGLNVSETFCQKLKCLVGSVSGAGRKWPPVMISVKIDAFTDETYELIHNSKQSVKNLAEKVKLLNEVIPNCVYPQLIRMNENESELEAFYRYWNDKNNESNGNLIIQKYSRYCGLLPSRKPADLSPLERNVCWHLRRDFTILSNGDVPLCSQFVYDEIVGNVFESTLADIWGKFDDELKNHICGNYNKKCRDCDEFYTFNF